MSYYYVFDISLLITIFQSNLLHFKFYCALSCHWADRVELSVFAGSYRVCFFTLLPLVKR